MLSLPGKLLTIAKQCQAVSFRSGHPGSIPQVGNIGIDIFEIGDHPLPVCPPKAGSREVIPCPGAVAVRFHIQRSKSFCQGKIVHPTFQIPFIQDFLHTQEAQGDVIHAVHFHGAICEVMVAQGIQAGKRRSPLFGNHVLLCLLEHFFHTA